MTSAYGKWDAGMTVWGSTPTCRGFDHFNGFYSAASDYYSHMVATGFDYHNDFKTDVGADQVYTTHKVTRDVQNWITKQVKESKDPKTFAYVAHEAVHGPLEVPLSYVKGQCEELIPADRPSRRIYCGMVRAVDESVANITKTYKELGIFNTTLFILWETMVGYLLWVGTTILCEEQKQQHLKEVFAASLLRQGLEFTQAFVGAFRTS